MDLQAVKCSLTFNSINGVSIADCLHMSNLKTFKLKQYSVSCARHGPCTYIWPLRIPGGPPVNRADLLRVSSFVHKKYAGAAEGGVYCGLRSTIAGKLKTTSSVRSDGNSLNISRTESEDGDKLLNGDIQASMPYCYV